MKNMILFLLILVSFQAYAQKINFGVKGGLNYSTFANSKDVYDEVEPRVGFHFGLSLSKELSEKFSLRTEVSYSQKGITAVDTVILTDPFDGSVIDNFREVQEKHASYLDIPLLIDYQPIKNLHIRTGPQVSVLLSHEDKKVAGMLGDPRVIHTPKSVDFAWRTGIGYSYKKVSINLAYQIGLSQAYESSIRDRETRSDDLINRLEAGTFFNQEFKHQVLQLSVEYRLF